MTQAKSRAQWRNQIGFSNTPLHFNRFHNLKKIQPNYDYNVAAAESAAGQGGGIGEEKAVSAYDGCTDRSWRRSEGIGRLRQIWGDKNLVTDCQNLPRRGVDNRQQVGKVLATGSSVGQNGGQVSNYAPPHSILHNAAVKSAPLPNSDTERLAVLKEFEILDTPPELEFDDFTKLASMVFEAPVSLISLMDKSRFWFKSKIGIDTDELPLDLSFCGHTVLEPPPFVVGDTLEDKRFAAHPLVLGAPGVRFYAGAPLVSYSGHTLGTICVIDFRPRKLTLNQINALQTFARRVVAQMETRRLLRKHQILTEELRSSRERFELAMRGASDGFWDWNIVSGEVYYSPRFKESLGYTDNHEQPSVTAIEKSLHPDERDKVMQAFKDHYAGGVPLDLECRLKTKSGDYGWFLVKGQANWDRRGQPTRMVGAINDVTRRKEAEQALLDQAATLRQQASLLKLTHDPIAVCDMDDKILLWNRGAEMLYGWTDEEARGKIMKELLHSEPSQPWDTIHKTLLDSGYWAGEIRNFKRDGGPVIALARRILQRDDQGRPLAVLGMASDITKQKQVEVELQRAADSAENASRIKSDFLANMSHEIRTPMNGIIGLTHILLESHLSPVQTDYLRTIHASAESLLTIVNDILDFSKIEAGRLAFEQLDFNLAEAVEGTLDLFAIEALKKRNEIASILEADVPGYVRGDPGRVRQVLANLVNNANKFTENGQIIVRVSAMDSVQGRHLLRFEVSDTGIGVPAETQERLFQPFTQADGSTTRKYGGTGLGLAISKQLVKMMMGEMGVKSSPAGSTFWFTLQLEHPDTPPPTASTDFEGFRDIPVLVISASELERRVLVEILSSRGLKTTAAATNQEGLELFKRQSSMGSPFRVIILEASRSGGTSQRLPPEFTEKTGSARPILVGLTGAGDQTPEYQESNAVFSVCLPRPIKQSNLWETISRLIKPESDKGLNTTAPPLKSTIGRRVSARQLRILVAEDNIINQKVILGLLQHLGCGARTVANGNEALAAMQQVSFDIVLMDCQMPELDGYQTTMEIRRQEQTHQGGRPRCHIIAMTANAMVGAREECIAAGMDDYVSKPVRPSDVEAALDRYFTLHPGDPALEKVWQAETQAAPVGQSAVTETSGGLDVIDVEIIEELRQMDIPGESDALAALIKVFKANADTDLVKLHHAVQSLQSKDMNRLAHKLKGSCGNFGAKKMSSLCQQLETAGHDQNLSEAPTLLEKIQASYAELIARLEELQSQGRAAKLPHGG